MNHLVIIIILLTFNFLQQKQARADSPCSFKIQVDANNLNAENSEKLKNALSELLKASGSSLTEESAQYTIHLTQGRQFAKPGLGLKNIVYAQSFASVSVTRTDDLYTIGHWDGKFERFAKRNHFFNFGWSASPSASRYFNHLKPILLTLNCYHDPVE